MPLASQNPETIIVYTVGILLDQAPLQLDREGIKEREDGERGGGGRLLEGGDYFKHFGLRWRLFEGRLLFEDCFASESWLRIN